MRIVVASTAGFCMGVRRAVDMALEHTASSSSPLYTLGKLIHNKAAVDLLSKRGALPIDEAAPPSAPARILIRAHGVPPETQAAYESRGHVILDGTCPKVKTVHRVIAKYRQRGYQIVITGDQGHAEVIGLLGYAGTAGHLIQQPQDVDRLPPTDRICLVSQTTFDKALFDIIAQRLRARYRNADVVIKKTICSATERRQDEVREMARHVDAIVVVGGKDSANTLRLVSIAREHGTPTQHVETESEIDWSAIESCNTVGVTAGASTPHWQFMRIVDFLNYQAKRRNRNARSIVAHVFDSAAYLNLFLAIGASALYYAASTLQGIPFRAVGSILMFLYFLSMYLWNSLASLEMTQHLSLARYRFYQEHRHWLFALVAVCIALLIGLSMLQGRTLFYLMLFSTVAGSAYHVTIVPRFLRPLVRYSNLRDIPTSRDLFVALAWGTLLTFVPHALEQRVTFGTQTAMTFIWVASLAYLRALMFDLRDIEGDRIMGRETLVSIVGERRVRAAIVAAMRLLTILMSAYAAVSWITGRTDVGLSIGFITQLPLLLYLHVVERTNRSRVMRNSSVYTALIDSQFILAGGLSFLVRVISLAL